MCVDKDRRIRVVGPVQMSEDGLRRSEIARCRKNQGSVHYLAVPNKGSNHFSRGVPHEKRRYVVQGIITHCAVIREELQTTVLVGRVHPRGDGADDSHLFQRSEIQRLARLEVGVRQISQLQTNQNQL
jgi:hypothetical protein